MSAYCQLCGNQIAGRGKLFHHPQWPAGVSMRVCAACAQNRPRCRECGLPLSSPAAGAVCATCSRALDACLACGRKIQGKYYTFDGAGPYCEACARSRPACDVCAAPLTMEYWQLSDGRVICSNCHASAIYEPAAAAALYAELKERIDATLGLKLNVPTGLALVDRNQLFAILEQQQASHRMAANGSEAAKTLGLYARRGLRRGIYIQTGLPRLLFLQIAAHEFAHAWQGENCPLLRSERIHEGFAEWVAYHLLGDYGYRRGQERMLERQDLYGDGLRWALEVQQRHGPAAVIEQCRMDRGG